MMFLTWFVTYSSSASALLIPLRCAYWLTELLQSPYFLQCAISDAVSPRNANALLFGLLMPLRSNMRMAA